MKLNENTRISLSSYPPSLKPFGIDEHDKVPCLELVAYSEEHVPTYHKWMQSAHLLEMTSSQRLDLKQEYESMEEWRNDDTKLTFIMIDTSVAPNLMVGDVNICLLPNEEENVACAEVDVMIGEERCRRKGYATLGLFIAMSYITGFFKIDYFIAKILNNNGASMRLFEKKLKFEQFKTIQAFNETHYKRNVDETFRNILDNVKQSCNILI